MSILIKLQNFFKKDELFGVWDTDDGSGFIIVMGSWIEFKKNGTGNYESWSNGDEEDSYSFKGSFEWKRTERNIISIKEERAEKVEIIEYSIDFVNERKELSSKQNKARVTQLKGFWNFAQVMFKKS